MGVFPSNLLNFWEIETLTKSIYLILPISSPPNPFPPILVSKQGVLSLSKSLHFAFPSFPFIQRHPYRRGKSFVFLFLYIDNTMLTASSESVRHHIMSHLTASFTIFRYCWHSYCRWVVLVAGLICCRYHWASWYVVLESLSLTLVLQFLTWIFIIISLVLFSI